ncbi:hypothetical protein RND71_003723 [Anisodus tanguticus]|uniref:WRKY domain-containing protein n=1 Tax=Anisodus tanguticus TaxID=243964 RepID=A0AAE1SWH1_9SOLA|nr:hypothetical protein RND71_003723 [Anisodus tanguticus]
MESELADLKMIIKELNLGQDFTSGLRELIIKKPIGDNGVLAQELVEKIMASFCKTLKMLNPSKYVNEYPQIPVAIDSSCRKGGRRSPEDSSGSCCKKSSSKDQRFCNKKRKISGTSVKETSTLLDDGHVWRKYGQKQILDAPYPRSYYRCTHKFDQGCEATKQEQRIQENPPQFRTMYQGHHTCTTYPTVSQIFLDSQTHHEDSSILLSFDSNVNHYNPYFPTFPSTKKDMKEEVSLSCFYPNQHQIQSSSSDYFLPFEYDYSTPTAETFGHVKAALSSESDNGNFISSGSSCTEHCMEMMLGSIDFEDLPFSI